MVGGPTDCWKQTKILTTHTCQSLRQRLGAKGFKQSNNMGLNNHSLKIFNKNNRNVDSQSHGRHHFGICAL